MFIFEIEGIPIPWAAPRLHGKKFFNPKCKEQRAVIAQLKSKYKGNPIQESVSLDVHFYMPIPKSTSKKKTERLLHDECAHIKKPDRSNLLKFFEDCIERAGIVANDSQIVAGMTTKQYGKTPKTLAILKIVPYSS